MTTSEQRLESYAHAQGKDATGILEPEKELTPAQRKRWKKKMNKAGRRVREQTEVDDFFGGPIERPVLEDPEGMTDESE